MARLRQVSSGQYNSPSNIAAEFENIIRYVNAAELGDHTVGELFEQLFDEDGVWDGPVEFQYDTSVGLQYRVGEYTDPEEGWTTLISTSDIRGESGVDVGLIGAPVWSNRQDFTATNLQTDFDYTEFTSDDDIVVFCNGLLQREGLTSDYTVDVDAQQINFVSGRTTGDKVTIVRVRTDAAVQGYVRSDLTSTASQAVFAFVHDEDDDLLVYKNGILQREGGGYDYTTSFATDTITFTSACSAGDKITIIMVNDSSTVRALGLMLEDAYTNGAGLIPYDKLSIANGDIPQAKISGLTALLSDRGHVYVDSIEPSSPAVGDLWVDTGESPNILKFYTGTEWLESSPNVNIPTFTTADAGKYVRVNTGGTDYELATLDLSSRIPTTSINAPSGVAGLDSSGLVPVALLPEAFSLDTLWFVQAGAISNTTYEVKYIFKQKIQIDAVVAKLSSGTVTIQVKVDGVAVGDTVAVSSTQTEHNMSSSIEVDATSGAKLLQIVTTLNAAGNDLKIGLAIAAITA